QRLLDQLDAEGTARDGGSLHHGEAAARYRDRVAHMERVDERDASRDREPQRAGVQLVDLGHGADLFDYACEHQATSGYATRPRTSRSSPIFSQVVSSMSQASCSVSTPAPDSGPGA